VDMDDDHDDTYYGKTHKGNDDVSTAIFRVCVVCVLFVGSMVAVITNHFICVEKGSSVAATLVADIGAAILGWGYLLYLKPFIERVVQK